MVDDPNSDRLSAIFFPYQERRATAIRANGDRFAYYTTAEVAASILTSKKIWLRNPLVMNDFREIGHGFDCLTAAYNGPAGTKLKEALEACFVGLAGEVEQLFNSLWPAIRRDSYLYCLSEHLTEEDSSGRLSMWRAYGGSTGVAIVINGAVMHAASNALGVYSSPVFYADAPEFADEFMKLALRINAEVAFLKTLDRTAIKNVVFQVLRFGVLCTKHPGFREELEWRVIAAPSIFPSQRSKSVVEIVRGVPQLVVKIDLADAPEEGLVGLALPQLLDRVIIGPCEFPLVTAGAFFRLLSDLQIPNPGDRIVIADIPLRHST